MRNLFIAVSIFIGSIAPLSAQNTAKYTSEFGRIYKTTHSSGDPFGQLVDFIDVPALTAASVTWIRTGGSCNFDLEAGTSVAQGTWARAQISGFINSATGSGDRAKVLIIPPAAEGRRIYVGFYVVDNQSCSFQFRYSSAHIPTEALKAAGLTALQAMVEGIMKDAIGDSDPTTSANIDRGVQFAFSMLMRDNAAAVSMDMLMNEFAVQATRQFPENRYMAVFVTNLGQNVVQNLYEDYFRQVSR